MFNATNARILTITTDGNDREDGNVYYSTSVLVVSTGGLKFQEDFFSETYYRVIGKSVSEAVKFVKGLGYEVIELPNVVGLIEYEDEDEDDWND